MRAATRRNLTLLVAGAFLLALLWQVPGRQPSRSESPLTFGTPRPTPTAESHWRLLYTLEGKGDHDFCAEGREVALPGPWRIRATPTDRDVEVRVIDRANGLLFARVWAAGKGHGDLATLPQGNGTYCLQVKAQGEYTLYVEAWEAPQG